MAKGVKTELVSVNLSSEKEISALKQMYFSYIAELLPFEQDSRSGVSDEQSWLMQFTEGCCHVWIRENGKNVGFIFYGPIELEHQRYWEIVQFYVIPSSRRTGVGSRALDELLMVFRQSEWRADRLMYLVLRNNPANAFWDRVLSHLPQVRESAVDAEDPDDIWYFRKGILDL